MRYVFVMAIFLAGCGAPGATVTTNDSTPCGQTYYNRDTQGNLKKYQTYLLNGQCMTDNVALTAWEASTEQRRKLGTPCTPQPQFASRSLVAANNYYAYRDGKVYLDLDASKGEYRRLMLGEDAQGKSTYSRLQGCFYERTGAGVDAAFGSQLLLDTYLPGAASTDAFNAMEIFKVDTDTSSELTLTRFDQSDDWDGLFCPYLNTPWDYCTLLRDGNTMYWPTLSVANKDALLTEALLIRKQFSYSTISKSAFEAKWSDPGTNRTETDSVNYKYAVVSIADVPWFIDAAWREYVMGTRPTMPNVNSNKMPNLCYKGKKRVILSDGTTALIDGEICYADGQYVFTGD